MFPILKQTIGEINKTRKPIFYSYSHTVPNDSRKPNRHGKLPLVKSKVTHSISSADSPRIQNYLFNSAHSPPPSFPLPFFSYGSTTQFWALAVSIKLSVSFWLLDLGHQDSLDGWSARRKASGVCLGWLWGWRSWWNERFGQGNRRTWRKPAPKPLCPPLIPLARSGREPGPPGWEASD
jgi:hypothetical protein